MEKGKKDILEEDITGYNTYLEEIKYCQNNNIETLYAPLIINKNSNIENITCYEYKTNYLLYLWLSNKLK